ncbi:MAG: hypothetical protein WC878_03980 [Candidatus Paceibacterota bacterium]|jgi:hypothetical protein
MKKLMLALTTVFFLSAGMAYAETDDSQDSSSAPSDSTYDANPSSETYRDVDPKPYLERDQTPAEQEKDNYTDDVKKFIDDRWS